MYEIDELCKAIKNGNHSQFIVLLGLKEVNKLVYKITNFCFRKTSYDYPFVFQEVIFQLWIIIKNHYPSHKLTNEETKKFLFGRRLSGRVMDSILINEKGMIRKQVKGRTIYVPKLHIVDQELSSITEENYVDKGEILLSIIENIELTDEEYMSLVLYWDLNLEPLNRERGKWSILHISKQLNISTSEVKKSLKRGMEKIKEYVDTKGSFGLHRAGTNSERSGNQHTSSENKK